MTTETEPRAGTGGAFKRFFTNQTRFDFIGRSRMWFTIAGALVVLSVLILVVQGLNFGIDFTGGTAFVVEGATQELTAEELREALGEMGVTEATAQVVGDGEGAIVNVPVSSEVGGEREREIRDRIAELAGVGPQSVSVTSVGPRWGAQISQQALEGLFVFLILVVIYMAVRFEWRMAVAALVTLIHDVAVTVGVYALVGFEVSPASVIALLTILGYSLYDTVVVFDRVKEEATGLSSTSNETYAEVANRSVNEVLLRSLSTSITSILPVGSLLFIGANLLGADTLSDLALALFVGMAVGTYSSVVVATPALVWLKEREPRFAELKERLETRRSGKPDTTRKASSPGRPAKPASGNKKKRKG